MTDNAEIDIARLAMYDALREEQAAHDRTAKALVALEQRLQAMEEPINACLFMSGIHGAPYDGLTWQNERAQARAALAAYESRRKS